MSDTYTTRTMRPYTPAPTWSAFQVLFGLLSPVVAVELPFNQAHVLGGEYLAGLVALVALAFCSPFFPLSFFALITQTARDRALVDMPAPLRALLLIPYLAKSPDSGVRLATWANLFGLCFGLLLWLGHVTFA